MKGHKAGNEASITGNEVASTVCLFLLIGTPFSGFPHFSVLFLHVSDSMVKNTFLVFSRGILSRDPIAGKLAFQLVGHALYLP